MYVDPKYFGVWSTWIRTSIPSLQYVEPSLEYVVCGRVCGMSIRVWSMSIPKYVSAKVCQFRVWSTVRRQSKVCPECVNPKHVRVHHNPKYLWVRELIGFESWSMSTRGEVGQCNVNQEYVTPSANIRVVGS